MEMFVHFSKIPRLKEVSHVCTSRFLKVVCFGILTALCIGVLLTEAQAKTHSAKQSAHHLMNEMSESDAEEDSTFDSTFDSEFDSTFDSDSDSGAKSKDSKGTKGTKGTKGAKKDSRKSDASKDSSDSKSAKKSGKKPSSKESLSRTSSGKKGKAKTPPEPEDLRTPEEKERDRMAHFEETGIWLWPELTPEQVAETVEKQKSYMEDVKKKFPQMIYYESEHFFYFTDAPKPIALECLKYLELMYARLCEVFEFPKGAQVWNGKCIVCAFVYQQGFVKFEQEFFGDTSQQFSGASGLAHMSSDGNVLISLFYGDISTMEARWKFIGILVHESTHGFLHKYRARQRIPLWLNEGIADFMPGVIVPADRQHGYKQRSALQHMQQFGSVGGLMQTEGSIEAWQYGVASGLVEFLLKNKPHGFKKFLDEIKDGKDWETALKENYNCTPEEFLILFGRANRIPRLTF